MSRRFKLVVVVFCLLFAWAGFVQAMTSTNYTVSWDSINSGGEDTSSSTNYRIRDTIGEQGTGTSTSSGYQISAGYRVGDVDNPSLSFSIGTQENNTKTAYSAFSSSARTVTVASVSSFSTGTFIGIVENEGLSQIIAIGKIISISGLILTVDQWDGSPALLSASPAGGDDFVYRLEGHSVEFGKLSASEGKTSLTGTRVTSDATNGYTVYVSEDGDFRYMVTSKIFDVADGSVTIGSEEYGWRVFGSYATNTGSDKAFTTSTVAIQQSTSTATIEERSGLVYKVSINPNTSAGSYEHTVYYTVTANY